MSEKGDRLREAAQRADEIEALEEEQRARIEELKRSWLISQPTNDHSQIEKDYAYEFDISLSDAKKQLSRSQEV